MHSTWIKFPFKEVQLRRPRTSMRLESNGGTPAAQWVDEMLESCWREQGRD